LEVACLPTPDRLVLVLTTTSLPFQGGQLVVGDDPLDALLERGDQPDMEDVLHVAGDDVGRAADQDDMDFYALRRGGFARNWRRWTAGGICWQPAWRIFRRCSRC
jgi:hypothetical protein